MPIYEYENPETGEVIEIIQSMNDPHEYTDEHGLKWTRLFFKPNAEVKGTPLNLNDPKDVSKWTNVYKKRYDHSVKKGIDPLSLQKPRGPK